MKTDMELLADVRAAVESYNAVVRQVEVVVRAALSNVHAVDAAVRREGATVRGMVIPLAVAGSIAQSLEIIPPTNIARVTAWPSEAA